MNDATASTAQTKTPTLQDIERMVALVEAMPPEPFGEWMRQLGFSPEQWRVVLPETMRARIVGPALWPDYVAFSSAIDRPVFVPRAQGLGRGPTVVCDNLSMMQDSIPVAFDMAPCYLTSTGLQPIKSAPNLSGIDC